MAVPLAQAEADDLRTMPKRLCNRVEKALELPLGGGSTTLELESIDRRLSFQIDVNRRGRIKLTRCSFNERYRVVDVLARLDIDGPPHTNPLTKEPPLPVLEPYNGMSIPCPHFHFYVEGFEDKWAVPAESAGFLHTEDLAQSMRDFLSHCGVAEVPTIQHSIL